MKTLRLIGSVIMAIMISMNFIACSDDDDDKNPNDKRLIRVEDSEGYTEVYKYDGMGRVSEYQLIEEGVVDDVYTYVYTDNKIAVNNTHGDDNITYTLKNGRIVSADRGNGSQYSFKYDNDNQLIEIKDNEGYVRSFTWNDNNIVKLVRTTEFGGTYTDDMPSTNIPYRFLGTEIPFYDGIFDNALFMSGYLGKCCKNLPSSMRDFGNVDYQIDNNGHINAMIDEDGDSYRFFYE
jgi:YD repeat-containing protein